MPGDARTTIVSELVSEFVEERVRQHPGKAFDLAAVRKAIAASLKDADAGVALAPADDALIAGLLDRHPFVVGTGSGAKRVWKPGLDKAAVKGGAGRR